MTVAPFAPNGIMEEDMLQEPAAMGGFVSFYYNLTRAHPLSIWEWFVVEWPDGIVLIRGERRVESIPGFSQGSCLSTMDK
jgi:hypothetical protein